MFNQGIMLFSFRYSIFSAWILMFFRYIYHILSFIYFEIYEHFLSCMWQLYRIPSRSVSPYGCITHMLSQMADTSRLYNSSGVADLICYPRWLIAVDYITHQVQQIYQAYQICSTQQKGLGLTADLMFHTHQSKAEDLSIIWDVIESKALACNIKIGKGGAY